MDARSDFSLVFAELRSICEAEAQVAAKRRESLNPHAAEVTPQELDEIETLRQIVLEATEPTQMSFTTT